MSPTFRSLHVRNYRLFASGQVISNSGTWMQRTAQDWLVLQLTGGSGTALGITTALQFLPMLLFGLFGGVLADRYPKRRLLVVTQTFMGLLALTLGILTVTGGVEVWHVYLLAFGLGVATCVDNPTRQAFVVEMVGPEDVPNAVGLNSAVFNLARILGPAIAGLLIGLGGSGAAATGPVFFLNAASYVGVLIGLKMMRPAELYPSTPVKRERGQLREGLAYVRRRPDLITIIVLVFFVGTFGMNFQITIALMATHTFHTGAAAFGILSTALAGGSLLGALGTARRRGAPRLRMLITAAVSFGILEVAAGLMPTYLTFLVLLVPTGFAVLTMSTACNTTMQMSVSPQVRGRVMSLYLLVFMGGTPIGAPLIGWLAEVLGPRSSLLIGGAVSGVAAIVCGLFLARSHGLGLRAIWRPYPHWVVRPLAADAQAKTGVAAQTLEREPARAGRP